MCVGDEFGNFISLIKFGRLDKLKNMTVSDLIVFQWTGEPIQVVLVLLLVFIVCIIISKLTRKPKKRSLKNFDLPVENLKGHHRWVDLDMFPRPTYCNVCESNILQGGYCDTCGICADDRCEKIANKLLCCKQLELEQDKALKTGERNLKEDGKLLFKHHWVRGNLPLCTLCDVCGEHCGDKPSLCDVRCTWCDRTLHDNCKESENKECDLGKYKDLILPPNSLRLKLVGWKGRRHWSVAEIVNPPESPDWSPLIVLANRESGNQEGEVILQAFRSLLNPAQVIDLHDIPPERALQLCDFIPNRRCLVLACGGDGTVGWVLKALDVLQPKVQPHVGILPLGTGNDLARTLGWGDGFNAGDDVLEYVDDVMKAKVSPLDRWTVSINHVPRFKIPRRPKVLTMNNYVSVGCDALLTLNFHRQRKSNPSWFTSRMFNKAWYLIFGAKDMVEQECKNLHKKVQLELDGVQIDLPELEGIVILNIAHWGGNGMELWKGKDAEGSYPPTSHNDGQVEVVGLYSSFHMARLQGGLADPVRLGQAKEVKLTIRSRLPMQMDGEPWEQGPSVVNVSCQGQALMLAKS